MARKLVTVRSIKELRSVPGASRYQAAIIDGWSCIVKKGVFTTKERVLFFEVDSFLPPHSQDARFAPVHNPIHHQVVSWQGRKGIHVKSTMMNKIISQGVVLKLSQFPEITDDNSDQCLAEKLGVTKWELTRKELATTLGKPPAFIPSTDLERVQNCTNLFTAKYKDSVFQESTKMDGSSMTVYFVRHDSCWRKSLRDLPPGSKSEMLNGRFGVCSRNADIPETAKSTFWDVALKNHLPQKLARVNRNVAIQGELCGSSIQQNRHGFRKGDHEFFVFSIFDIDTQERFAPAETVERAQQLNLKHVPVHGDVKIHDIATSVEDLLKRAEGTYDNGKKREGLVFKNLGNDRSFKIIANNYLLTHGE
ncbi:RNA ligase, DRB0094 family [Hypoxylon fuscum]|nr:RNA ligase, DRB0094 family [Hypoxylon fuscum]